MRSAISTGTHLYEHSDPRQGFHPDWDTFIFNFGRPQVANFLIANALFWLDKYHVDGLRVDAVASMLYRDYSRKARRVGAQQGRRAARTWRRSTSSSGSTNGSTPSSPDVLTIAEESTSWPLTTRPTQRRRAGVRPTSGTWAGCTTRWRYFQKDPVYRKHHHNQLTFRGLYAFDRELRPAALARRGGLRQGVAPGQDAGRLLAEVRQRPAPLRLPCTPSPARKCSSWATSSASGRSGTTTPRSTGTSSNDPMHAGLKRWVRDLNTLLPRHAPSCTNSTPAPMASPGFDRRRRRAKRPVPGPQGALDRRPDPVRRSTSRRSPGPTTGSECPEGRPSGRRSSTSDASFIWR